jgi:hypothetical protein
MLGHFWNDMGRKLPMEVISNAIFTIWSSKDLCFNLIYTDTSLKYKSVSAKNFSIKKWLDPMK